MMTSTEEHAHFQILDAVMYKKDMKKFVSGSHTSEQIRILVWSSSVWCPVGLL